MKKSSYHFLYRFLAFITQYVNSRHLIRLKMMVGSSLFFLPAQAQCELKPQSDDTLSKTTKTPPVSAKENREIEDVTCYVIVEDMPQFPSGNVQQYIQRHLQYPLEAREKDIQGKVYVRFTIRKDGSCTDLQIISTPDSLLNNEAIRLFKSMPRWQPARQGGKAIDYSYTVPVEFKLPDKQEEQTNKKEEAEIFCYVMEDMPYFQQNVQKYIATHLRYPDQALKEKIEGKVYVQFIIDTIGRVTNVKIIRSPNPLLNEEAVRVVSEMPNWKPGKKGNKPVNTSYTLPIRFELPKEQPQP